MATTPVSVRLDEPLKARVRSLADQRAGYDPAGENSFAFPPSQPGKHGEVAGNKVVVEYQGEGLERNLEGPMLTTKAESGLADTCIEIEQWLPIEHDEKRKRHKGERVDDQQNWNEVCLIPDGAAQVDRHKSPSGYKRGAQVSVVVGRCRCSH